MNAIEFIKERIDRLVTRFTNIRCRYEHDLFSNTHLIEVLPAEVYNNDESYAEAEVDIISEFIELFPYESICFVTDDALTPIQEAQYIKSGTAYDLCLSSCEDWLTPMLLFDERYRFWDDGTIPAGSRREDSHINLGGFFDNVPGNARMNSHLAVSERMATNQHLPLPTDDPPRFKEMDSYNYSLAA